MRSTLILLSIACNVVAAVPVRAQFGGEDQSNGVKLDKEFTECYKVGMTVRALGGPCHGLLATIPVPTDWPEQKVRIVDEEITPNVRHVNYRTLEGGVKQMLVSIPYLANGEVARALVTFEVRRYSLQAPDDPASFVLPTKLDRDTRRFLAPSPYIESRSPKIRALAKKIVQGKRSAWEIVEAIYDWVRDNIEYKDGRLKGALAALRDGNGDCEELTSLFIALCRANKVPARTVWVPGHCYPEFYLSDERGGGYWIPCQAAGEPAFGSMPEHRPILQKGDNFKVPEKRERQRYVAELLKGATARGGGRPKVQFVREQVGGN